MALLDRLPPQPVIPLMGYPGIQLTGSSLWQNETNPALQARTIAALAAEFNPDAVFPFMDLTIEAGAIGLPVHFPLHESPTVTSHPVRHTADIDPLRVPDIRHDVRVEGVARVIRTLKAQNIGLVGGYVTGPFTLAGLMMGAGDVALATRTNPDLLHAALDFATTTIQQYAAVLVDAGADMIAILEPTASFISAKAFDVFSGPYVVQIIAALDVPAILHICGKTTHLIPAMAATGADALSLDTQVDLAAAARQVPQTVGLIGNIDPVGVMAHGDVAEVQAAVHKLKGAMQPYVNFVISTGCDLPPETPLANIAAFMDSARASGG